MPTALTRKVLLWLGVLTGFASTANASDTLTIAARFYHVDHAQHLILINQRTAGIPVSAQQPRRHLALDQHYTFDAALTTIATDSAYRVRLDTVAYTVYFAQLPVVDITTRYHIVDAPSVYARLALTQPSGQVTEAALGIEIRGGFSQTYPKKSYELSFWSDSTGQQDTDVSLLGMRTDNKYNLQALYNEPLRIRSKTANALWQQMHQIYYQAAEPEAKSGIDAQYTEVFINGRYHGLYALTERIDRKQLKLKKYNNGITGELYKGADWAGGATIFSRLPAFDNASDTWGGFEYKHPDERIDWRNLYDFVDFVQNSSNADFYSQYRQKFHLATAVDYYIFLNLLQASDNTGKNLYIARYKQGEPYYYVPWDLDGVFGTDWQGLHFGSNEAMLSNGFYDRLLNDCSPNGFRDQLRTRWTELRQGVLTHAHIMALFEANSAVLTSNNVYAREQLAWPAFRPNTAQYDYIGTWLTERFALLDANFSEQCSPLTASAAPQATGVAIYPNPATDFLTVEVAAGPYELTLRDVHGRVVLQTAQRAGLNQLDVRHLPKGLYLATLRTAQLVQTTRVLLR